MEEEQLIMQQKMLRESFYLNFENFLVKKWGEAEGGTGKRFREEDRKKAYKNFQSAASGEKIAVSRTIRKWFGLNGSAVPGRSRVIRICLVMHFSVKEADEYLKYGISESGLQVNDYTELAAMYCLDHGLGLREWEDIQDFYELNTASDPDIRQTAHTDRIMELYKETRELELSQFMVWMCKKEELFKGYSRTTYDYFCSLIDEVLVYFREDAKEILLRALKNADFDKWAEENGIPSESKEQEIRRFVKNSQRNRSGMSKELSHEIQQLYIMAYSSENRIKNLLEELGTKMTFSDDWKEIHLSNPKYISELLSISIQKIKEMRLRKGLAVLEKMDAASCCPDWLCCLLDDEKTRLSVSEAKKKLRRALTMQSQRVRGISRADLLLPAQYIASRRYEKKIEAGGVEYRQEDAVKEFTDFANTILETCCMRPLDKNYRLDAALLACFGTQDMILFSELVNEGRE